MGGNEGCFVSYVWPDMVSVSCGAVRVALRLTLLVCAGVEIRQESLRGGSKTAAGQVLQL